MLVRLGYEVGTGAPVDVPIAHMVVTGQTQLSGKTTTLEALVSRAHGMRALAFCTKRGEGAFGAAPLTRPYFRERADWKFVSAILEAEVGERLKFERSWIMKATRGARTLRQVRKNVERLMGKAREGLSKDVYMMLGEYLDAILPVIEGIDFAPEVKLRAGCNVVDLRAIPLTVQGLVISSMLTWVHQKERDVTVVLPESWKFIPQGRNSPVKMAAVSLAREGGGIGNLLWLDSQDLAGAEKEITRQASVYVMGVQREVNEIKRSLAHIPAGTKKPRAEDVARLGRGEFYACWGQHSIKTYVQPAWMDADSARQIAMGDVAGLLENPRWRTTKIETTSVPSPDIISTPVEFAELKPRPYTLPEEVIVKIEEDEMNAQQEEKLDKLIDAVTQVVERMDNPIETTKSNSAPDRPLPPLTRDADPLGTIDEEALVTRIIARLKKEAPAIFRTLALKTELHVREERREVTFEDGSLKAKIAQLYVRGWFKDPRKAGDVFKELSRLGHKTANPRVWEAMKEMAQQGLFFVEDNSYSAQPDVKVVVEK